MESDGFLRNEEDLPGVELDNLHDIDIDLISSGSGSRATVTLHAS